MCQVHAMVVLWPSEDSIDACYGDESAVGEAVRQETIINLEQVIALPLASALRVSLGEQYVEGSVRFVGTMCGVDEVWIIMSLEVQDVFTLEVETLNNAADLAKALLAPELAYLFGYPTVLRRVALG